MIEKADDDFLDTNIKGMMMTLVAHWNLQMLKGVEGSEFEGIRASDLRVFGQLRGRSVLLSQIHREMGFTRQAAHQAIERLVKHGMLRVEPSKTSLRDKVVTITAKGQRRRALAAQQIKEIEANCVRVIGRDEMEKLRGHLAELVATTAHDQKQT